jgi:hypothetical protein
MRLKFYNSDEVTNFIDNDDSIYHFTKRETAIAHILNSGKLMFGDFKLTNDPWEYKKRMTSASGWNWNNSSTDKILEITDTIDKIIETSGFLSFCQNSYNAKRLVAHGCLKSRMWSQYGESHSGICLVFSKSVLLNQLNDEFSIPFLIYNDSMSYENTITNDIQIDGEEINNLQLNEIVMRYISSSYQEIFFNKQIDYRDECEFRIVAVPKFGKSASGALLDISQSIKTIILGDAFPDVYLPTIKELSNKLNVPYRRLHWGENLYFLLQN